MPEPEVTRGVAVWVVFSTALSTGVCLVTCVQQASEGNVVGGIITLLLIPILSWLIATIGAGVINLFVVTGQVMTGHVTESVTIQGKSWAVTPSTASGAVGTQPGAAEAAKAPTEAPVRRAKLDFDGDLSPGSVPRA